MEIVSRKRPAAPSGAGDARTTKQLRVDAITGDARSDSDESPPMSDESTATPMEEEQTVKQYMGPQWYATAGVGGSSGWS